MVKFQNFQSKALTTSQMKMILGGTSCDKNLTTVCSGKEKNATETKDCDSAGCVFEYDVPESGGGGKGYCCKYFQ